MQKWSDIQRTTRSLVCPALRLIVWEDAARNSWPAAAGKGKVTVVIAQPRTTRPVRLVFSVSEHLAALERSRRHVESAVFYVAPSVAPEAAAARSLIARALMDHMSLHGGEMLLAAEGAPPELRHELLELIDELLTDHPQTGVRVRLQLGARPSEGRDGESAWDTSSRSA